MAGNLVPYPNHPPHHPLKRHTPAEQAASARLLATIRGELDRAKSKTFIADYYRFYDQPRNPPAWMVALVKSLVQKLIGELTNRPVYATGSALSPQKPCF